MSFEIQWTIQGEKQVARILEKISTDLKDFKLPLNNIASNLIDLFGGEVFETRGAAIQESWAALSPYTLATKARKKQTSEPLIATGAMRKSFRSIVTSDQAVIYNLQDYFKYHQSNEPRTKIPRRVMMKIANRQKEMIVKEFVNYIRNSKHNV